MGNRTARNTGLPGTGVEAIGDEGKMTPEELVKEYTDKSKPFPLPALEGMYVHPRYVIHQHDLQELIDALRRLIVERDEARAKTLRGDWASDMISEAEARGYRRGVEDAAGVARTWDTTGQGHLPNANGYDAQAVRIAVNILALLKQNGNSRSPHPKSGAGASAEAK
jgi:hypothetical protein